MNVWTSPLHFSTAVPLSGARAGQPGRDLIDCLWVPVSRGRTMHVTIFGPTAGPPAVALHGLGGNTEQMLPALEAVAQHYGLRIYAIDLPNHGRSCKVGILDFQVRFFADLILETVTTLKIDPTVIFGHSFGGQLAAILAEDLGAASLQPILINPALCGTANYAGAGGDRGCSSNSSRNSATTRATSSGASSITPADYWGR
jgi:pimeloyl-ACP methyl ester carboxylesterase